jgi:hypothetical protein
LGKVFLQTGNVLRDFCCNFQDLFVQKAHPLTAIIISPGTYSVLSGTYGFGLTYGVGDAVTNAGTPAGVIVGAQGVVGNTGNIIGAATDGVDLGVGGTITNAGAITGGNSGVGDGAGGVVVNTGRITGTLLDGVVVGALGTVINAGLSTISGGTVGDLCRWPEPAGGTPSEGLQMRYAGFCGKILLSRRFRRCSEAVTPRGGKRLFLDGRGPPRASR